MLRFRELEHTTLHAGLGVRLIDDHTNVLAFGLRRIFLDVDDAGTWREVPPELLQRATTASGVVWFPWLEKVRDARGRLPRRYRVRATAEYYAPAYLYDAEGVEVLVDPYDDVTPPAASPAPVDITLLPAASYPYDPSVPVLRGRVEDIFGEPVPHARVGWLDPTVPPAPPLVTDLVLSDDDGEFSLPMRRAPFATPIEIHARRPPPPFPGRFRKQLVQLPGDLSTFLTMTIL
jgi:hypothetical protein